MNQKEGYPCNNNTKSTTLYGIHQNIQPSKNCQSVCWVKKNQSNGKMRWQSKK